MGTIRAALYEGSTNITDTAPGYLETTTLGTGFSTYTLVIPEADAQTISSYENLEIRFWGYAASGTPSFAVASVGLQIPEHGTWGGAVSLPLTASISTIGTVGGASPETGVARISLGSGNTPATRTAHALVLRARVSFGAGTLFGALYEGASNRSGDLSVALSSSFTDHRLAISEANAQNITSYSDLEIRVWGEGVGNAVFEVAAIELETDPAGTTWVGIASETSSAPAATAVTPPISGAIYPGTGVYPSETLRTALPVGVASEASSAFALVSTGGAVAVLVGVATESNAALTREAPDAVVVGIASETASAFVVGAVGGAAKVTVGIATETNIATYVIFDRGDVEPPSIELGGVPVSYPVIAAGTDDLFIGYTSNSFIGVIDEVAILGTAISDIEVKDLWQRVIQNGSDGRAYDSTTGIWSSATNGLVNGGFEASTSPWTGYAGATIAQDTTEAYFGTASLRVSLPSGTSGGVHSGTPVSWTAGAVYTGSAWVKGNECVVRLVLSEWTAGDVLVGTTNGPDVSLDGTWKRLSVTRDFGATGTKVQVSLVKVSSSPATVYLDGAQIEVGAIVTPYIETNGVAVSRGAARIDSPSSLDELTREWDGLSSTQGWVAARVRLGWANGAEPSSDPYVFSWRGSDGKQFGLYYDLVANAFVFNRDVDSVSVAKTITLGERVTLVAAWTTTQVKLSVNGAAFTMAASTVPSASWDPTVTIGSDGDLNQLNGDIIWFCCSTGSSGTTPAAVFNDSGDDPPRLNRIGANLLWDGVDDHVLLPGRTYGLATGPIRRISHEGSDRRSTTTLDIIDALEELNAEYGTLAAPPLGESMRNAIWRVLNAYTPGGDPGQTLMARIDFGETGLTNVQNDGTRSWLQVIVDIVLSDFGLFFVNGDGEFVFKERRSRPKGTYKGRVSREMRAILPSVDLDRIANSWTVSAEEVEPPIEQTANFIRSQRRYRVRKGEHSAPHLRTADQAYSLAEHLVRHTSEPDSPIYGLELDNRSDRMLAFCLGLGIGDIIYVFGAQTAGYYVVEQLAAEANVSEGRHRVGLVVSRL